MSLIFTIFKIVAVVGMGAIILSFLASRKDEIQASIQNTQQRLGSAFDSLGNPFDSDASPKLSPEQQLSISSFDRGSFLVTSQPNPEELATLTGNEAKQSRILRELELSTSRPELTFATSLEGSQLALGEQIKRDTGFNFAEFDANRITLLSSDFEKTLASEQSRARAISLSLFGNVQNPNFELGLPSDASPDDIRLALEQRATQDLIGQQQIANTLTREEREERGLIIQETLGTQTLEQKEALLQFGINLQGQSLSPLALAKLQESGLLN